MRKWKVNLALFAVSLFILIQVAPFSVHGYTPPLAYNGPNPIVHESNTYAIFWLPSLNYYEGSALLLGLGGSNSNYESYIMQFFSDIGGSSFYNIVTQYYDSTNGTALNISNFKGYYVDTNPYPLGSNNTLTDTAIRNEIVKDMAMKGWAGGLNNIYFVFTGYGIHGFLNQNPIEPDVCGYHSAFLSGGQTILYANLPDYHNLIGTNPCASDVVLQNAQPTGDPWADEEVNTISHELFETITDPLGSLSGRGAWLSCSGYSCSEMADVCQNQYALIGPDYDLVLNGHKYIVQEEWSNYNNDCVISFGPSTSISINLKPTAGVNVGALNFSYSTMGMKRWTIVNSGLNSSNLFIDSNSQFTISSIAGPEQYCLTSTCSPISFSVVGSCPQNSICNASFGQLYYYDLVSQTTSANFLGGGIQTIPLSYVSAPSSPSSTDSQTTTTVQLSSSPQTIWVERGTTAGVASVLVGSGGTSTERWIASTSSWVISSPLSIPNAIPIYHQYLVTFSYSISGGGSGYTPLSSVAYHQFGNSMTTPFGQAVWVDSAYPYSYSGMLTGSTSSEQWALSPSVASGTVTTSGTVSVTYYHQYLTTLSYNFVGGASQSPPSATMTEFGQILTLPLAQNTVTRFLDAGSTYQFPTTLSGTSNVDRWLTASPQRTGTVSAPTTVSVSYYHQYALTFSYSLIGGGSPTAPSLSGISAGLSLGQSLTQQPSQVWVDANSAYTFPIQLSSSNTLERWQTEAPTTGVATSPASLTLPYYNQFLVSTSYSIVGGTGSSSLPMLTSISFGVSDAIQISQQASSDWLDSGAQYSITNPLGGSSASERWFSPSSTSGTISSSFAINPVFYDQYLESFDFAVTRGGSGYSPPSLSYTALGSTTNVVVSTTLTSYWLDAESGWQTQSILSGSTSSEQWIAQVDSGSITASDSYSLTYINQYSVILSVNQIGTGLVNPSGTAWYNAGSAVSISATSSTGYGFSHWSFTNGIVVSSPTSSSTTAVISSAGQVGANFDPALIAPTGGSVNLPVTGNVSANQVSGLQLSGSQSNGNLAISFVITGQSGTIGLANMTIPKSLIPNNLIPRIFIDGQVAPQQSYVQDNNNYYVAFLTHFSSHNVQIEFFYLILSTSIGSTSSTTSHSSQSTVLSSSISSATGFATSTATSSISSVVKSASTTSQGVISSSTGYSNSKEVILIIVGGAAVAVIAVGVLIFAFRRKVAKT